MSDFKASSTLDLKRPDPAKPTDPTKLDKHGASGSTCLDSIDNKPSISTPLESNSTVSFAASTSKTGHAKGKAKAKAKGKAKTKAAVASSSSAGDKAPAEDSVCNVFCYRFFVGGGELPNSLSLFPHFCFFAHTLKKRQWSWGSFLLTIQPCLFSLYMVLVHISYDELNMFYSIHFSFRLHKFL
eukprot:GEMP01087163.1.p1 GENE.GEMP01087163.1~~GEMP01087163.1.p1  ORF type:complete len:184 (+),score=14.13 GEMP01087163.1:98-649(+)